jgi:hypothetical protein
MNSFRKLSGWLWLILGPLSFIWLLITAVKNITSELKGDISNPIPWIIILVIFLPIAAGFTVFGWYALKGEYDEQTS